MHIDHSRAGRLRDIPDQSFIRKNIRNVRGRRRHATAVLFFPQCDQGLDAGGTTRVAKHGCKCGQSKGSSNH